MHAEVDGLFSLGLLPQKMGTIAHLEVVATLISLSHFARSALQANPQEVQQ